jgi:extracellular factor (EF) 3-hydroxypalmitic acid methyl ester biosynthesis protein
MARSDEIAGLYKRFAKGPGTSVDAIADRQASDADLDPVAESSPASTVRTRSAPPVALSSFQPRPSSRPPRPSSPPSHEELVGATGSAVTFRPTRLSAVEVPAELTCSFRCEGVFSASLALIDLSANGFSAAVPPDLLLAPGSVLESLELRLANRCIWSGQAVVVHGSADRIGARFSSGVIDLQQMRLGATLEGRLAVLTEQRQRLPEAWRAEVADLRHLLEEVRGEIEAIEREDAYDPLRRRDEEGQLFEALRDRWGGAYYEAVTRLHEMSRGLDDRAALLGRSYASSMLMPLLAACPLHKRSYEKPLGYAGDYRMMELCFAKEPVGESLFGRFLFSIAQSYTLARAVVARERVVRDALRRCVEQPGTDPVRILAVAAGPAMELRRWLDEVTVLERPVELMLLDQDRAAHESAHRQITRVLFERHRGMLPVTVRCLHFSVSQLISRNHSAEERAVLEERLADLDLVYSTGLYDYLNDPVATRLTRRLYGQLREGGKLLLGNLDAASDTTWILDYVLDWPLIYREESDLLQIGRRLSPVPTRIGVTRDDTGRCLFLDVTRSS